MLKLGDSSFDRHAREEVRQRALMQQKLAEKEKAQKEENLRMLAQRAREERSSVAPPKPSAAMKAQSCVTTKSGLVGHRSHSDSDSGSSGREDRRGDKEDAAKVRGEMKGEMRREREREMRMSNMGTEGGARARDRDERYGNKSHRCHDHVGQHLAENA